MKEAAPLLEVSDKTFRNYQALSKALKGTYSYFIVGAPIGRMMKNLGYESTLISTSKGDYYLAFLGAKTTGDDFVFTAYGISMKGNTSRREIADTSGNITASCHFKISLKATFDDALYDLDAFKAFKHDWSADAAGLATRKKRTFFDMSQEWFDTFVYQAVVLKKYLSPAERAAAEKEPKHLHPWDPMGTLAD